MTWKPSVAVAFRLALAFCVLSPAAALAAPHGMLRVHGSRRFPFMMMSKGPLLYYGGPVIPRAKVYAVFWGDRIDPGLRSRIGTFYSTLFDSGYMDRVSQYSTVGVKAVDGRTGSGQTILRGSFIESLTIQPENRSANLTDAMIQKELAAQIAEGRLPAPDDDALYMTYFPAGVSVVIEGSDGGESCASFTAYHEGFRMKSGASVFYGVMPDCGGGSGQIDIASSHEMLEAITDPFPAPGSHPRYPQAWNSRTGDEVADLCESEEPSYASAGGSNFLVERWWDNSIEACVSGPWSESQQQLRLVKTLPMGAFFSVLKAPASLLRVPLWDGR